MSTILEICDFISVDKQHDFKKGTFKVVNLFLTKSDIVTKNCIWVCVSQYVKRINLVLIQTFVMRYY